MDSTNNLSRHQYLKARSYNTQPCVKVLRDHQPNKKLLEYPIPPPPLCASRKSGWRYLGNEKGYRRSVRVKTTGKNLIIKKSKKQLKKTLSYGVIILLLL